MAKDGYKNSLNVRVEIPYRIKPPDENGRWAAGNDELDIWSYGATRDEARLAFGEVAHAWFEPCIERGTLKEALSE